MTEFDEWISRMRDKHSEHAFWSYREQGQALRMLEVAIKALYESRWEPDKEAFVKINQIAKERNA